MSRIVDYFNTGRRLALGGAVTLALGAVAGAGASKAVQPPEVMAPAAPVAISSLETAAQPWIGEPVVAVRGRIDNVYGGQMLLNDGTGTVLVDLGREAAAVAPGETVTVQGSHRNGTIRARYLIAADGRVAALHPRGPRGEGRGRHNRGGRGHERPDRNDRLAPEPAPEGNGVAGVPSQEATQPAR